MKLCATTMSVEENVVLIRRWFKEVWNEGRTQTVFDLVAPDAVAVGQLEDGIPLRGPAEFAEFVERTRGAFPDIKVVVEDVFGVDDKVALRWSATMTHSGDHLGMPATGKPVRLSGITVARFADNKIVEGWDNWDQLGMLKQIGVYRSPERGSFEDRIVKTARLRGTRRFCNRSSSPRLTPGWYKRLPAPVKHPRRPKPPAGFKFLRIGVYLST